MGGVCFTSQGEKHLVYNNHGTEETHIFHQTGGGFGRKIIDSSATCRFKGPVGKMAHDRGAPTSDR